MTQLAMILENINLKHKFDQKSENDIFLVIVIGSKVRLKKILIIICLITGLGKNALGIRQKI